MEEIEEWLREALSPVLEIPYDDLVGSGDVFEHSDLLRPDDPKVESYSLIGGSSVGDEQTYFFSFFIGRYHTDRSEDDAYEGEVSAKLVFHRGEEGKITDVKIDAATDTFFPQMQQAMGSVVRKIQIKCENKLQDQEEAKMRHLEQVQEHRRQEAAKNDHAARITLYSLIGGTLAGVGAHTLFEISILTTLAIVAGMVAGGQLAN